MAGVKQSRLICKILYFSQSVFFASWPVGRGHSSSRVANLTTTYIRTRRTQGVSIHNASRRTNQFNDAADDTIMSWESFSKQRGEGKPKTLSGVISAALAASPVQSALMTAAATVFRVSAFLHALGTHVIITNGMLTKQTINCQEQSARAEWVNPRGNTPTISCRIFSTPK